MIVIDNKIGSRIRNLAEKSHRTFNQQLELMVETFEIMPIHKVSIMPYPQGGTKVPVVEVDGQVVQRG